MSRSHGSHRRVATLFAVGTALAAPLTVVGSDPARALGTGPCPTTACVSIGSATVVEGDTGQRTLSFPVTLSRPATGAVSMKYRLQNLSATGGATVGAGVDYIDKAGALQTLTFVPSAATGLTAVTKLISVKVLGDTAVEATETMRVTLSALTGPARLRRGLALGTIIDDDAGVGAGIRAGIGDGFVAEGDVGKTRNLVVPITLSGASTAAVALTYTVSPGTATFSSTAAGGGDFGGKLTGVVNFAVSGTGVTGVQRVLNLPVWADAVLEPDEGLSITISAGSLPAGVTIGRATGTGTIVDDDAVSTTVPAPNSMAVLGDSISRAYNACPAFGECPASVWSTGTDIGVDSHYTRLLALNPTIAGNNHNDAVSGTTMANLDGQAALAVGQNVDYVTIEMGGNDGCKNTEAQMTATATYQAQFQQAMTTLTTGLPNAHILVASVPDILQLWVVAKDVPAARSVWSFANICQTVTANPLSVAQADVDRRARVRQRVIDYNSALATVCAQFANCRFDQNAVFNSGFALSDVSSIDYFHPSYAGQTGLALLSYGAGWDW